MTLGRHRDGKHREHEAGEQDREREREGVRIVQGEQAGDQRAGAEAADVRDLRDDSGRTGCDAAGARVQVRNERCGGPDDRANRQSGEHAGDQKAGERCPGKEEHRGHDGDGERWEQHHTPPDAPRGGTPDAAAASSLRCVPFMVPPWFGSLADSPLSPSLAPVRSLAITRAIPGRMVPGGETSPPGT